MKRVIVAEPHGGLANRLRFLDGVFYLAETTDADVDVIWLKAGLNCAFGDLFMQPPRLRKLRDLRRVRGIARLDGSFRLLRRIRGFKEVSAGRHGPLLDGVGLPDDAKSWRAVCKNSAVRISGDHRFVCVDESYSWLKFQPRLMDSVEVQAAGWEGQVVGVHVRRTDNTWSIENSPTEDFFEVIDNEIATGGCQSIFLATDDVEEERRFRARYGDRIHVHRKRSLDRNKPIAIKDALIDFLCLARTGKIFGSYWSSFSEEASRLGRIPLITVNRLHQPVSV